MSERRSTAMRTHVTGALGSADADTHVALCGWVHRRRDHGGLVFIDLRDRYGLVQCVAHPERVSETLFAVVEALRAEDVVRIEGQVVLRPAESVNADMPNGEIEVEIAGCEVLAAAETPPFPIDVEKGSGEVSEELRLRHRYLDLRRPDLVGALGMRHRIALETRKCFDELGFWEIETPMLTRRTPEGARDYLVPSRVQPGKFYALPQSPQLYKQLLMIGGYDRYFQIARCFRDEDLRADRQPEFTQIDLEMAFVDRDDVLATVDTLFRRLFMTCLDQDPGEIPRLSHAEAMARFGTDKPDLRIGHELTDVTDVFRETGFRVFDGAVDAGGHVVALRVPGGADVSRSVIDRWTVAAQDAGAGGLVWARYQDGAWRSSVDKFIGPERWQRAGEETAVRDGDLLLVVADRPAVAFGALGVLRVRIAGERGWVDTTRPWRLVWIVDFPLFEPDEGGRPTPSHHPFTAPIGGIDALAAQDPMTITSAAYDLVLNGYELGSGSIRIHERAVQERVLAMLGIGHEEAVSKFGFLLEAFEYGAPPHGGIALGLDRIAMLFSGAENLRGVIAFPKTTRAVALMEGAPSAPEAGMLDELHIAVTRTDDDAS